MIIMDLNQVMISNLMAQIGNHTNIEIDENLLRHMILNTIRMNNKKFSKTYGELVIACDDKNYWRRDIFPHYKAHRKKDRDKSELDWKMIFGYLNKIRDDLKEHFPYKVIQIDRAEADDVIATLVEMFAEEQKILILSGDKDFIQLHRFKNVEQFSPILKKKIRHDDPVHYLKEHIVRGDRGDGIPNIASDDDTFVSNTRQKPLRKNTYLNILGNDIDQICWDTHTFNRNWQRNRSIIDLSMIPNDIKEKVADSYHQQENKQHNIIDYFITHKLSSLTENIGDFYGDS